MTFGDDMWFFHRHKWGPWGSPEKASCYLSSVQRRECLECGCVHQRDVGKSLDRDSVKQDSVEREI